MHLILTGATGTVGAAVLHYCLSLANVTQLSILSRRPVPLAEGHAKAKVIIHNDYGNYPQTILDQLTGANGCIWAQGKSQIGMKKEDYIQLTHDYPVAAAKAFSALSNNFTFVYVSGEGADPEEKASSLFGKVKGRTEKDLLSLQTSSPSLRIYNVRPGYVDALKGGDHAMRTKSWSEKALAHTLGSAISLLYPSAAIPTDKLATVLVRLASGDGAPLEDGKGIEAGGRTVRNTAVRRFADL